jgi:hypothetical protein
VQTKNNSSGFRFSPPTCITGVNGACQISITPLNSSTLGSTFVDLYGYDSQATNPGWARLGAASTLLVTQ